MNNRNELFEDSKKCIYERRNLKAKLRRFTNECIQKNCEDYLKKISNLNLNELNNNKYINNEIRLGLNFHFNKNQFNSINRNVKRIKEFMSDETNKIDNDYKHFCKTLKNDFSVNELEAIKSDQLYYIPDINIRSNLKINKNLIIDKNNYSSILDVNKRIYAKFCKRKKNINYKNLNKKIRIINGIIKTGIKRLKNEEIEKNLEKERIRKLLQKFREESKKEVHSLINDKSYKKLLNEVNEKSFFKEYEENKNKSFLGKYLKKNKINKIQNSLDSNRSQSTYYFPDILLKKNKQPLNKKLFNESKSIETYRDSGLKLSKNLLYDNYMKSIINHSEDFRRKRVERNIRNRKIEDDMYKKFNKIIKDNYAKKAFAIYNIKKAILNNDKT